MDTRLLQRAFISIALITGMILVFIMPPLQMPDENSHFKNIYSMSNFDILADQKDSVAGRYYPVELLDFVNDYERLKGNLDEKYSFKELYFNDALYDTAPLSKQEKVFESHSAQSASPIMYLPQIIGVWIFKLLYSIPIFGGVDMMKPIHYMYAARIGNLIGYIIMGYYILKWIPIYKKVVLALMLMPMSLTLAASVSYDVMVIGVSFLFIAYILRIIYSNETICRRQCIVLLVLASILIQLKIVYFCFIGLFILAYKQDISLKKFIKHGLLLVIIPMSIYILINAICNMNLNGVVDVTANAKKEQVEFILLHPIQYIKILLNTFITWRGFYVSSFVGKFGSLDTNLPDILILIYCIYLIILALFDSSKDIVIKWKQKAIYFLVAIMCIVLTETALYIVWTALPAIGGIGHEIISGVQGRYFIPCSILMLLILYSTKLKIKCDKLNNILESHFIDIQKFYCIISCIIIFVRFWV